MLAALVRAMGLPVTREALKDAGWGDPTVADASLTRCVHALRRALALPDGADVIETLHGQGFRIALPVKRADREAAASAPFESSTGDARVFDLYLQAREFQGRRTAENLHLALLSLTRATTIDPTYLGGWLALARLHVTCCLRGLGDSPATHAAPAVDAAERALALDTQSVYARGVEAWVKMVVDGDAGAAAAFDTSEISAPTFWEWRFLRAWALAGRGDFELALSDLEVAGKLNPMRPGAVHANGYLRLCAGDATGALDYLRRATATLPSSDHGWATRAITAAWRGHHDEAIDAGCRATDIAEGLPMITSALAYALACAGYRREAREMLTDLTRRADSHVPATLEAAVHVALEDDEAASNALDRARRWGCPYRAFARFDPRFEPLVARRPGLTVAGDRSHQWTPKRAHSSAIRAWSWWRGSVRARARRSSATGSIRTGLSRSRERRRVAAVSVAATRSVAPIMSSSAAATSRATTTLAQPTEGGADRAPARREPVLFTLHAREDVVHLARASSELGHGDREGLAVGAVACRRGRELKGEEAGLPGEVLHLGEDHADRAGVVRRGWRRIRARPPVGDLHERPEADAGASGAGKS